MKQEPKDYTLFGEEWVKEMMKFQKPALIEILKVALQEKIKLQEKLKLYK